MTLPSSVRRPSAVLAALGLVLGMLVVGQGASGAAARSASGPLDSHRSQPAPAHGGARSYIVVLRSGVALSTARRAVANQTQDLGLRPTETYSHALRGYAARMGPATVASLRADPRVAFVERNVRVRAVAPPARSVSAQSTQVVPTGVQRIGGQTSSTASGDGTGTVDANVAVLDSGIDPTHPDLNVVGGTRCSTPAAPAGDLNGHGTGVAGLAGALDDDADVVGIAPGVRLWDVRVLGSDGSGTTAQVICGIDWVTATRTDSDPSNDIQVANMSFAAGGRDDGDCGHTDGDAMHEALCGSTAAGVVYVAAAGNGKMGLGAQPKNISKVAPAAYDEVLTVSAISDVDGLPGGTGHGCTGFGADDTRATFTNFATEKADRAHLVAAPGVCQITTKNHGGTQSGFSGTSASAPLVAGTVALCVASGPCATLSARMIVRRIVANAKADNRADPSYGYQGDPQHPVGHHFTGYLIRASRY